MIYAPNKMETAEYVSRMLGQTTVAHKVVNISQGKGLFTPSQKSESYQHTQRPLMTADEVRTLPGPKKNQEGKIIKAGDMLIFISGQNPIYGKQILYFTDPYFMKAASIEPPNTKIKNESNKLLNNQVPIESPLAERETLIPRTKDFFYEDPKNIRTELQESSTDPHSDNAPLNDFHCEEEPPDLQHYVVGAPRDLET